MCSAKKMKMLSLWPVILVVGLAGKVGTSQHLNGCKVLAQNKTYSSLVITWQQPESSHHYQVKLWPLYSKKKNISATVSNNRFTANGLEPSTLYEIHVRVISSNKDICTAITRTRAESRKDGGLVTDYRNSTTVYAEWNQVKIAGAHVTYHAFIEWVLSGKQYAYIVYNGTVNYTWVVKEYIPKNYSFHVNVIVNRQSHHEDPGGQYPQGPTWNLDPSVVSRGTNFIFISWKPLPNRHGNVTYSVIFKSSDKNFPIVIKEHQAKIRNLRADTAYTLQVQARDVNDKLVILSKWKTFRTKEVITDFCASEQCQEMIWVDTRAGQEAVLPCPKEALGNITRKCRREKNLTMWDEPDFSDCVSRDIASIHDELQRKGFDPVGNAKKLSQVTKATHNKYSKDIKLIVNSLNILGSKESVEQVKHTRSSTASQAHELAKSIVDISSAILDEKTLPVWNQIQMSSATSLANKIIQSLDSAAVLLVTGHVNEEVNAMTDNVAIAVKAIPNDKGDVDQWLAINHDAGEEYGSSVYFPGSVLNNQRSVDADDVRYLSIVSLKTINQVLQIQSANGLSGRVQAPVVSVTLQALTRNKFDKPVVLTIARPNGNSIGSPTCAFLNVTNSSLISWSSEGCEVGSHNETHTQCLCYHLTSFAILMQAVKTDDSAIEKEHHFALSLITYAGLCTSIIALLLVFLTFALIRFLNLPRHLIHANLALSLVLAHVIFLFGIERTDSKVVCKVLAITLHYLFLVAFSWMALEGVVLYLMLVKVFRSGISTNKTKAIFIACGWGIPAVVVGISSAVFLEGYGTDTFCWLSLDRHFIWAFVGPVLITITFNFVWLGFTFYIMAKSGGRSSPKKKVEKLRYWVRSCCLLTCILGVTWLLGVFFVNKQTLVMAYLFSFLNSFQGLAIFLLHCVGDRKIRAVYLDLLHCHTGAYGFSRTSGDVQLYKRDIARDSSSDQKSSPKKNLMKQSTVSSLLRTPQVLQHIEQVKQSMETRQSAKPSHKCIERPRSNNEEESPIKSSTPLLKTRLKHPEPKSV